MVRLNFPEYRFDIREQGQKKIISDPVRKKLIPLTPEEWVRQHTISFLHHHYQIPFSRMAVERELSYNKLKKRFDVVVFDTNGNAQCIVECKAPGITITTETLMQISIYNNQLHCPLLWVTNGLHHYWFSRKEGLLRPDTFPERI